MAVVIMKYSRGEEVSTRPSASYFADNININFRVSLVVVDQMMVYYWVCASCRC